jgi:DNA-binding GntR family transcriptional regulator
MVVQAKEHRPLRRVPETGRSIGGNVASILRAAVISGQLQPGDRLGQDELCAELGVSQAPVREALRKLEAEGLVEHKPNRGVFVLGLPADELLNVVAPTRVLLESYAIKRVLATDRDDLLTGLERILREMRVAAKASDKATVHDLDLAFHDLPIQMSGQPHTIQLWRSIMPRVRAEFTRLGPTHSANEIVSEHKGLLAAIRGGDPDVIETALFDHAVLRTKALIEKAEARR